MKIHQTGLVTLSMFAALAVFFGGVFSFVPSRYTSLPEAKAVYTSYLYPTADGATNEWSASTGTRHFGMVNELGSCDGNTTYTYTTSTQSGNLDEYIFNLSSIPPNSIIQSITIQPCVGIDAPTGTSTVQFSYTLSDPAATSTLNGALPPISVTPSPTSSAPAYTSPQTQNLSFTITPSTSLKIGVSSMNTPNAGVRLSQLGVLINYSVKTSQLYPVSDGSYLSWQPSNYAGILDEPACDSTSYMYTTVATSSYMGASHSVSFNLSSIPNGSTIKKITVQPCASVYNSGIPFGAHNLRTAIVLSGAATSTVAYNLSTANTTPQVLAALSFPFSVVKQPGTQLNLIFTLISGNLGAKISNANVQIEYQ